MKIKKTARKKDKKALRGQKGRGKHLDHVCSDTSFQSLFYCIAAGGKEEMFLVLCLKSGTKVFSHLNLISMLQLSVWLLIDSACILYMISTLNVTGCVSPFISLLLLLNDSISKQRKRKIQDWKSVVLDYILYLLLSLTE